MIREKKEIALFIPCFNEEKRLKLQVFETFIQQNKESISFYFIDDGSDDKTSIILKNKLVDNKDVFCIVLKQNKGKGNAIRQGILEHLEQQYEYYGFIDADLDIPLNQVNKLYAAIKNSNHLLAISQRSLKNNFSILKVRSMSSLAMVLIANKIIGFKPVLQDTQCGCKLFRKEIISHCFHQEFISEWLFDIEIFLRLKNKLENSRELILEVPLHHLNKSTASNFQFSKNLKIFRQLFLIHSNYNK